jgi:hydrogenase maturation protease
MNTRVVGVGGPIGDDSVGFVVLRELEARRVEGVELRSVAEPSQLVPLLGGVERVVIVDALLGGGAPGTVRRLRPEELAAARPLSTHGVDVAKAIELARIVAPESVAKEIVVVGIAIGGSRGVDRLSAEVASATVRAVEMVLETCKPESP